MGSSKPKNLQVEERILFGVCVCGQKRSDTRQLTCKAVFSTRRPSTAYVQASQDPGFMFDMATHSEFFLCIATKCAEVVTTMPPMPRENRLNQH